MLSKREATRSSISDIPWGYANDVVRRSLLEGSKKASDLLIRITNDIEEMETYERGDTFRAAVISYLEDLREELSN